ncbi:MAG: tRNA 4-thiouridine(8) synthase ThiI, partial [Erysipelotrichia bacterium]|nr:tRNA 4-thiouridine(8) synthase ThiI [Erysipelotrichia bacterium]
AFDYSILDEAVKKTVFVNVDEMEQDINEIGQMEIVSDLTSGNYTVIDIRQNEECINTSVETLKIPFYSLKNEFKKLPQDKTYLFYCDKGILSQLHAQYLRDSEGFTNIKVYRPL